MSLRGYITNNIGWKKLSLLLAIIAWLTIDAGFKRDQTLKDNPVETTNKRPFINLPVALMAPPSNTNRYRPEPAYVDIEITGSHDALTKLKESEIKVFVDLSGVRDERQVRLPLQWQCPAGLKVSAISQGQVNVERLPQAK